MFGIFISDESFITLIRWPLLRSVIMLKKKLVSNEINKALSDRSIEEVLLTVGIMLIPYDALKVMPSEYRPIAIFPLLLALFFCFANRSYRLITVNRILLLAFCAYAVLSTLIISDNSDLNTGRVPSFILTLGIGLFLFFTFSILFFNEFEKRGVIGFFDWLFTWLSRAYVIPVFVGLVEMLSLIGLLPHSLGTALSHFFGSDQQGRLTLTSYEASWASFHLLMAMFAFCYRSKLTGAFFPRALLIISVLLFLYSQSMQGFLVAAVAAFIYIVWLSYIKGNFLTLVKWVSLTAVAIFLSMVLLRTIYLRGGYDAYYTRRLLGFDGLDSLIRSDGSSFVRIIFPVICVRMFFDHLVFGIGGGMFASFLPGYIYCYYPWATSFGEIAKELTGSLVPSAVCLYTRVLAEHGVIGGAIFIPFLIRVAKNFCYLADPLNWKLRLSAFFLIVVFCMPLQFASYAFLPLWLAFGLLDALGTYQQESS